MPAPWWWAHNDISPAVAFNAIRQRRQDLVFTNLCPSHSGYIAPVRKVRNTIVVSTFSPLHFRRFRQALRPEGCAKMHLSNLGQVLRAMLGDEFLRRRIHRRRCAPRKFYPKLFFEGAQA